MVIPKEIRQEFEIKEGKLMLVYAAGDRIILKKEAPEPGLFSLLVRPIRKKNGRLPERIRAGNQELQAFGMKPASVVADTNIVSAIFWKGSESKILPIVPPPPPPPQAPGGRKVDSGNDGFA
ncbi:MAG: AbrB/MazE/SpoVT family DNA-binding domain-containing protein [Candidatus Hadarchaeales archaeon]